MRKVPKGGKGSTRPTRAPSGPRKKDFIDPDDLPLNPDDEYGEDEGEIATSHSGSIAPFSDGIVSARLSGLAVIPRIGGEEVTTLRDFLELYAKTDTYIGSIASKTSFMKKKGGLLM